MKILYAASEAMPFIKTGGLADVAGALPAALSKIKDNEVCVILPYYKAIKYNPDFQIEFIKSFGVPLAWRHTYAGLFKAVIKNNGVGKNKRNDIVYYFIDNEYYFGRDKIYGNPDDVEVFAYFCKAVLECLQHIELEPDVIHCNDWQTGFIPLFLKSHYPRYQNIKTVFTIHNIEYQGKADKPFISEVLGVSPEWNGAILMDNLVNAMKTAIVLADKVNTVSRTYSYEIRNSYYSHGLHSILNENSYKLSGIVNGIDVKLYNPQTDKNIAANYKTGEMSGKALCKEELQKILGLTVDPNIPIVSMISRFVKHKGMELIEYCGEEMLATVNAQFAVLGTGDKKFEDYFRYLAEKYPGKISVNIKFDSALAHKIYAGSDMFLMPSESEPCGLSQIIAMRYGVIPIVRETGGLVDTVEPYNPQTQTGRGFTFKVFNAHDMLGAVRRSVDFYFDTENKDRLVRNIMKIDSSWKVPAEEYMGLYT